MPHRLSLLRRLAELRVSYTGETESAALPAISQSAKNLDHQERAGLVEALEQDLATRLLGENSIPPLPRHIRHSVLPDATAENQRELEAGIALAASSAVNYLHLRQPIDLAKPARIFRMIRPQPSSLVLHLNPEALAPLLLELLPRRVDDDLQGIPGLRARLLRRHIELYLVDADPPATVLLANVSFRQWSAALAFVDAASTQDDEFTWLGNEKKPLTQLEEDVLRRRHRVPGPTYLTSALLRRGFLFSTAPWLTMWTSGCNSTSVEWPAGPSIPQIAKKLIHPITGLPGSTFQILHSGDDYLSIVDHDGARCATHPRMGPTRLVLRTAAVQASHLERLQTSGWHNAETPWLAWEENLAHGTELIPESLPPRFS